MYCFAAGQTQSESYCRRILVLTGANPQLIHPSGLAITQSLEGPFLEQPIIYTESTTPVSLQLVPVRTVDLSTDSSLFRGRI